MGKRIIVLESEKKQILSLYEQIETDYIKENNFLKKYVGKTFIIYDDKNYQTNPSTKKIESIDYNGKELKIKTEEQSVNRSSNVFYWSRCLYNPSKFNYELTWSWNGSKVYNKTLIDDIFQKGTAAGINWCQKPKSDFGSKSISESSNTVTPPPSESVLVVKDKNPFKYPEYESARKEYSSELKDGDMFYVYRGLRYYADSFNTIIKNNLLNKTIRDSESDSIYKISSVEWYGGYPNTKIILTISKNGTVLESQLTIPNKNNPYLKPSFDRYSSYNTTVLPYLKKMIEYVQKLISDYDNFYIDNIENKNNLQTVPDKYFDIRKIQRQKTDF